MQNQRIMSKYEIRIDGEEYNQTFTLDELLNEGFLDDYDPNIEVRAKGESVWVIARDYPYNTKEKQNKPSFIINEDGTVTRRNSQKTTTSSSISSTSASPPSSSSTNSSTNDGCVGETVGWIICIAIAIAIAVLCNI